MRKYFDQSFNVRFFDKLLYLLLTQGVKMAIKDETYFQFESVVECGTLSVIPNYVYKPAHQLMRENSLIRASTSDLLIQTGNWLYSFLSVDTEWEFDNIDNINILICTSCRYKFRGQITDTTFSLVIDSEAGR